MVSKAVLLNVLLSQSGGPITPIPPYQLFTGSDQGGWYDATDNAVLWDYVDGNQHPADGGVVGRILSKASWSGQGIDSVVGSDVLGGDGAFNSGTGWTPGTGWSITGGKLVGGPASSGASANHNTTLVTDAIYLVEHTIDSVTSGSVRLSFGGGTNSFSVSQTRATPGTYRDTLNASNNTRIQIAALSSGFGGQIDNVTAKKIPGDHARSTNNTNKPTWSGNKVICDSTNKLVVPFSGSLGSNCTVVWVTDAGVSVLTGQTISGTYDLPYESWYQAVVISRALTYREFAGLTMYLEAAAGLS